jgi:hypothetical protein
MILLSLESPHQDELHNDTFSVSGETSFAYLIYKNIPKLGFHQFRQFWTYRKIY